MVYAIVETGGKQVRVEPGRFYDVELLALEVESTVALDRVLLVRHDGGVSVGQPLVAGASVQARVLQHGKAPKVIVYKMRPKKHYRRKKGHRQPFTRLMIEAIDFDGQSFSAQPATST
ncbi:50S ribosomal protein L21 [Gloeobacter kilaueensis]|uniref:Large ribosomal subunit protein bL21 n=1 Tax=Gloeobacter kilaueensis (strain ATCC BAA-2537 / CCAP 1431/1 / ULC 316 / JS1) TaxID=1183438 RepID=U5QH74_GLOK1|nr:50S ribosomal protein L21 [Gloeobacter kilaueensis]AGY57005.1 50S ribosomal protein L21 [Gloeobacter kilaueensis JS1]